MVSSNVVFDANYTIFDAVNFPENATSVNLAVNVCPLIPPKVISDGFWGEYQAMINGRLMPPTLTVLELQMVIIFIITQCFHFVLKRLGFPYFVSQMMTGFLLGPSVDLKSFNKYKQWLFPYGSEDILSLISLFGYVFFMFVNCVQMDISMVTRTGRKAWALAIGTILVPIMIGLSIFAGIKPFWDAASNGKHKNSFDVQVIGLSGYSFAIVASLLSELDILNSELGRLALSSALVGDALTNMVTGIGTTFVNSDEKGNKLIYLKLLFFVALIVLPFLIGRPLMRWIVRSTPEGRPVKKIYTYSIVIVTLIVGLLGTYSNQTIVTGMVFFGLAVPDGPPLGTELVRQFELFSTWVFLPIFVTSCTMKVDLAKHGESMFVWSFVFFAALILVLKMLVCMGISRYCRMPKTDGFCLGLILSCKGAVELCQYTYLYDSMKLTDEAVALMILCVVVMGTTSRIGVKYLYDPSRKYAGYQKRNILHLKPNSELRVVTCIHRPSHIGPMKNVLDLCCPTTSNPLVVDVLHLMELVGRSTPIFISHRLQEKVGSNYHNYSGDVIVTFDLFEHDNSGAATVNTYTAISPLRLMHEDICHLGLDKLASMIILPFHVRWADDGTVESDDESLRSVNSRVLERAPCSVGILVNRGPYSNNSLKKLAVIFLGGSDDREALCLAKRTIKDCAYILDVFHLVASSNPDSNTWDTMLDEEVLKTVKGSYGNVENVTFEKITIEDPSQTTNFVLDIANQYDYIIVGRRYGVKSPLTSALDNWTEYPELGAVGDLLASSDANTKGSILVVQQQQLAKSEQRS